MPPLPAIVPLLGRLMRAVHDAGYIGNAADALVGLACRWLELSPLVIPPEHEQELAALDKVTLPDLRRLRVRFRNVMDLTAEEGAELLDKLESMKGKPELRRVDRIIEACASGDLDWLQRLRADEWTELERNAGSGERALARALAASLKAGRAAAQRRQRTADELILAELDERGPQKSWKRLAQVVRVPYQTVRLCGSQLVERRYVTRPEHRHGPLSITETGKSLLRRLRSQL